MTLAFMIQLFWLLLTRNMSSTGERFAPRKLSARFRNDFAYYTVKDRLPVTLTTVIDSLSRKQKELREKYGEEAGKSVKSIIGSFSEMKSQLQTNKAFTLLNDDFPDKLAWNNRLPIPLSVENPLTDEEKRCEDYMELKLEEPSWFNSSWLLTECYFYRRIFSVFRSSQCFSDYDPFKEQKRDLLRNSLPGVKALGHYYLNKIQSSSINEITEKNKLFLVLIQASLWANRWDLSLFSADELQETKEMMDNLEKIQDDILCNDSEGVWNLISGSSLSRVDIVLDNSGLEFFSDLVLADFLCSQLRVKEVFFHGKAIPWFVSDVTDEDLHWTLNWLCLNEDSALRHLYCRWTNYIVQKKWHFNYSEFWTLPDAFCSMSKVNPNLYNDLCSSELILFKGDLNYRKLTGDRKWKISETTFKTTLMGFEPAPLCAIRTLKSDTLVGIPRELVEKAFKKNNDWLVSGTYGVIQFNEILCY